jgi:adenosylcobinamide-GDP ribazoletransferase
VGLSIGVVLMLSHALFNWVLPPWVAGVLTAALWGALTGGLHIDGLADTSDGLLASVPQEDKLRILRDPRVGAYGVLAVVVVFLLKSSGASSLRAWSDLILPPVLGRSALLYLAMFPQAREAGMGASFQAGLRRRDVTIAMLVTALVAGLFRWRGLLAYLLVMIFLFLFFRTAQRRIGGVTGDVMGAGCELAEVLSLLALNLRVH